MNVLFYDGACGLCHLAVRVFLAIDRRGVLRFAPLGGETFLQLVPGHVRASLPESLVLRTAAGRLLVKSAAVLAGLRLTGVAGRAIAGILRVVPVPLADGVYDVVARARRHIFRKPVSACPVVRAGRRVRFLP